MRAQNSEGVTRPVPKWVRVSALCGTVPSSLPLLAKVAGYSYLPAPTWVSKAELAAILAGSIMAVLMFWIASKSPVILGLGRLRQMTLILLSPVFGFMLGKTALIVALPMAIALLLGQQVELAFKIKDNSEPPSRRCEAPVSIADMPLLSDKLCFPSLGSRLAFQPGDSLMVRGRGTDMGIFVDAMRHGDP